MKRKFTFLIAAMALMIAIMSPREAWGQTTYTMQSYSNKVITSDNDATWTTASACAGSELPYELNSKRGAGFQANNTVTSSFSVTNASKISVVASSNGAGTTTLAVKVGTTTFGSTISVPKQNYQTLEFTAPANTTASGTIEFTITRSSKTLWIGQVIVETAGSTYTVTYDANGATSGSVPEDETEYDSGDEVTVLGNTGSLVKAGFVYDGWNTKADGSGTTYQADDTFEISGNTTLYAKWNAKTITNLTYTGTPTQTEYSVGDSFNPDGLTVTATFDDESQEDVTSQVVWTPNPLTVGTTSVTGTYMGLNVVVNGITVTGPSIVLNITNSPFTSTSSSNQSTEQVTLSGIEFENKGGYNYNNTYLSFNRSLSGAYLGNNTMLCGNINKIVVVFSSAVSSKFTMYEGSTALSETTSITPTLSSDNKTATYTFSGNTGYFKYKLTTTGTYCNISSIAIYLDECETHTVTGVASPELGGSVSIEEATLGENQTTQVTATPNSGYRFTGWTVDGAGSSLASLEDATTTFTMGTEDATITASFEEIATYNITIGTITGGTVTSDKEFAEADATVTLTAAAADGYAFNNIAANWSVTYGDNQPVAVTPVANSNTATFTMPAGAVNVSATFRPIPNNSWSEETFEAIYGVTTTFPTYTTDSDGTKAYTSSEETVATINSDGEITLLAKGTTTITASTPETATWAAGSASYTLTVVKLADLPFSFDGGRDEIATTDGMSQSGLGSDYSLSPKLKFDGTGDWVIIHYGNEATKLEYTIKGNSFSGSTFDVMESVNGTDYTTVKSYTTLGDAVNETMELASASRYVKFIYTSKSSGNVALGAIGISKVEKQTPVNTWSASVYEATIGGTNTFPTFETNSDGTKTYTSSEETVATINSTTGEISLVGAGETTITATTAATANFFEGSASYTLTVIAGSQHQITYNTNGTLTYKQAFTGENELDTPENIPGGYRFVGWATSPIDGTATSATYFMTYNITADVTFYAVFAIGNDGFEKVTSNLSNYAGEYVLVYEKPETDSAYIWTGIDANYCYEKALIINNRITAAPSTTLTFAEIEGGYSIMVNGGDNDGKYIYGTSGKNELKFGEEEALNTVEYTDNSMIITSNTSVMRFNKASNQLRFRYYKSTGYTVQEVVQLYKKSTGGIVYCTSVSTPSLPAEITGNTTIPSGSAYTLTTPVTVKSGATLTVSGVLGNGNPANLIIEDGGQVIVNNAGVKATAKRNITHHGSWSKDGNPGWYFISSPMTGATVEEFVTNSGETTTPMFDLYRWEGANAKPWYNYRSHEAGFGTTFQTGRGYLAAYSTTTEFTFSTGTLTPGTDYTFELCYNSENQWENISLLGNPFPFDMNWSDVLVENTYDGFATVNAETGAITYSTSGVIPSRHGFIVNTTAADATVLYIKGAKSRGAETESVNVMVSGAEGTDNTIIVIDGNEGGFSKIDNLNQNIATVYTTNEGRRYGMQSFDEETETVGVSFRAVTTGKYTIALKATGDINYLHLIDRMTGDDIDMLLEGSYVFVGSPRDNENRFIVRLGINDSETETENFVYQSGNELFVNGNGTLQVIDMLGRVVISKHINGESINVDNIPAGAYIVRMINNEVKTQKIVIK